MTDEKKADQQASPKDMRIHDTSGNAQRARLLSYAPSYLRRLAAAGQSPLPYVRRGNRRLYKLDDIRRFVTETVG